MPRPNPTRSLPYEANVATNVKRERERRGLTLEALASRMTANGCPIQPSALHKMEKGDPPRRITVNELWALAQSLELQVNDLVSEPRLPGNLPAEAWEIVQTGEKHVRDIAFAEMKIDKAKKALISAGTKMAKLLRTNVERRTLSALLDEDWADWPEVREVFAGATKLRGGASS